MLNIFILEDDYLQQTRLENVIKQSVATNNLKYRHLEIYGKPHQLLETISEKGNHQLFFLDIEIRGEEQKGMEIAREIRLKDPNAVIVFVSTHSEFMPVTYKYRVSALDFIDKGLPEEEFRDAVTSVLFMLMRMWGVQSGKMLLFLKASIHMFKFLFQISSSLKHLQLSIRLFFIPRQDNWNSMARYQKLPSLMSGSIKATVLMS